MMWLPLFIVYLIRTVSFTCCQPNYWNPSSMSLYLSWFTFFNQSTSNGHEPKGFKTAFIIPPLKKADMDGSTWSLFIATNIKSKLVLSKLPERTVVQQLLAHLSSSGIPPRLQSAHQVGHQQRQPYWRSCQTFCSPLTWVTYLYRSCSTYLSLFTRLTIRSAFSIWKPHTNLVKRCSTGLSLTCLVVVSISGKVLQHLLCSVVYLQGLVLRPILFLLYTAELPSLIQSLDLHCHAYADDRQIYGSCSALASQELQTIISMCTDDVAAWMCSNSPVPGL